MTARFPAIVMGALLLTATANAQVVIPHSVVSTGGAQATSTNFAVRGTIGQPVTGPGSGVSFAVSQGYETNPYAVVSGAGDPPPVRRAFALEQNYPNPFNPTTTIAFSIPVAARVRLGVFDATGAEVMRVIDRAMPAGSHRAALDASRLASGVYFYRLEAAGLRLTRKLVLLK